MPTEPISESELDTVLGGNGEPAGPICTPADPEGRGPQRYWENSPPAPHGGGGEHGGHRYIHPDPPPEIRRPPPWRPTITGRSDRRLKRRIRPL